MTWSANISGSAEGESAEARAAQETEIVEKFRRLVAELPGVTNAAVHTTEGGYIDLRQSA